MSLIGDCIISARELIPDMPQVLPPPTAAPSASVLISGGTIPAGTYFLTASFRTPWGETLDGPETAQITITPGQAIQITGPALPPSASAIRIYLTLPNGAAGSEQQFIESSTLPFSIFNQPPSTGVPPNRNTAWLPDSDGKYISAGTLYRWLNQGISRLARKAGGLQDYTGVSSVSGQPLYIVPGDWAKFNAVWYDGFPLAFGNQRNFFRRNTIQSSVLAQAAISVRDNRVILEVFYQPVRTAGSTTLSAPMQATDTTAFMTAAVNFQSFGPPMLAMIGNEIVALSAISGNNLIGLTRGLGGTTPQAWNVGTVVKELNIWILGKRLFSAQYLPGNAGNVLPLPAGWEVILPDYIMNRARRAEQQDREGAQYLKEFDDAITDFLRANRQLAGPVQAGGSFSGAETVPGFGSSGGGVVLP